VLLPDSALTAILIGIAFLATSPLLLGALPAAAHIRQAPEPELRELMQRTVAEADSFQDRFDAEVWLVDMSGRLKRYVPDAEERLSILRLVHREASKAGLKPELVLALIRKKSCNADGEYPLRR